MPRKKQIVQTKRRQKAYAPGAMSGDALHIKPRGAFRIFTNYKLFAIIGIAILGGGFLLGAYYQGRGTSSTHGSVRGSGVIKPTPSAGTPEVTGASGNSKVYGAPPPLMIDTNKTYLATFKTEAGEVKVQLDPKLAPQTVNNFVFLARDGFYNGSTLFRVIQDKSGNVHFVQGGDPTGTGSGGPGYDLPFERTNIDFSAGVIAMAKPQAAGAPNNGSQFFFLVQDDPTQDGKWTAFGHVVEGMDVLRKLTPRDPQTQQDPPPGARIDAVEISEL